VSDIVFINGLRAETVIGVYDWERNIRQPLLIDLELAADVAKAAETDSIENALDYATISNRVVQEVEASSHQLIETLAERLATMIRNEFGVSWLRLRITKPTAVSNAEGVGVIIERGSATAVSATLE
jgi:7,8-dihydroneopterin aldolase/epimerase/oxygenase